MNNFNYIKYEHGFSRIGLVFILSFVIIAAGFFVYQFFFIQKPLLTGAEKLNVLSADNTIALQGAHLKSIEISVVQNGKKIDLLKDAPSAEAKTYTLQIKPKSLALSDGAAVIVINAEAGIFKKLNQEIKTVIDTVPPSIEVISTPEIVSQGGAGFAVLRSKGAASMFVKLEDKEFPAFKLSAGSNSGHETTAENGAADYYVFFPMPFGVKENAVFHAIAKDTAGNRKVQPLHIPIKATAYRSSSINISDTFIDTVVSSLLEGTNISGRESAFKKVNEELRAKVLTQLSDITKKTEPGILWSGPFLQLKNSKVMAGYGDRRTYLYNGKTISHSIHLGYDLASNAHSPVEAANSGIVRFAGALSIYGNAVIIDHGMGLMSLYGHLSAINVSEGQAVNKGDIIGNTGSTGLAGGDHLHFGILIHGYEVSPLFWWDKHWIKVNILDHLTG